MKALAPRAGGGLQHLVGQQELLGLRFRVGPRALIPRPETELVVERLIAALQGVAFPRIADVGTGSGCIAATAAIEVQGSRVVAGDVSREALGVARRNVRDLGVEDRITFVEGSLGAPLREHAPFHAMAANLPCVTTAECERLEPEVRGFEPRLALDGGADDLDLVREPIAEAPVLLVPAGMLVLEVGHRQGGTVAGMLREAGFTDVVVHPDLAGIGRVVEGRRAE
jgi:release factor glutamine methyltransferase